MFRRLLSCSLWSLCGCAGASVPVMQDRAVAVLADDTPMNVYQTDQFNREVIKRRVIVPRGRLIVPPGVFER